MTDGQQTVDATQSPIPRTSVWRNKFFWLSMMLAVALVVSALLTHTYMVSMLGVLTVLMVVAFMVRGKAMYWCIAAVIGYGMFIWYGQASYHPGHGPADYARQNLHGIQMAVERYAVDHDTFPLEFSSVVEEGYLPVLPDNRFRRRTTAYELDLSANEWEQQSRMQQIGNSTMFRYSLRDDSDLFGSFIYLPILETAGDGSVVATAYELCVILPTPLNERNDPRMTHTYWLRGSELHCKQPAN